MEREGRKEVQHKNNCDNCRRNVETEWVNYPETNGYGDVDER